MLFLLNTFFSSNAEIVEKIKLEKNFVDEISNYKDILCLYLQDKPL